jgi:hypothetical protein
MAGKPLEVFPQAEEPEKFAYVDAWAQGLWDMRLEQPYVQREASTLCLANSIDYLAFREAQRPELDWSAIPQEDVFRFLVLHEVAHIRHGHAMELLTLQLRDDYFNRQTMEVAPKYLGCLAACEMVADRWAWAELYPGRAMPTRPAFSMAVAELEDVLDRFPELMEEKNPKPMTTDPRQYVPTRHVKEGIPWAVGAELKEVA